MKFSKVLSSALLVTAIAVTSCKKDDVSNKPTDSSVATTENVSGLEVTTKESGTNNEVVYRKTSSTDTTTIVLKQGKAYDVSVKALNNSNGAIDIVAGKERFYYTPSASSNIAVINLNTDSTNTAVGNTCQWITEVAGSGNINIVLKADDAAPVATITFNTRVQ